jgi:hypothetical protein
MQSRQPSDKSDYGGNAWGKLEQYSIRYLFGIFEEVNAKGYQVRSVAASRHG